VAINPSSKAGGATGGSLLGLAGNSLGAAGGSCAARRWSVPKSITAYVRFRRMRFNGFGNRSIIALDAQSVPQPPHRDALPSL
jgi:hypothetical protein